MFKILARQSKFRGILLAFVTVEIEVVEFLCLIVVCCTDLHFPLQQKFCYHVCLEILVNLTDINHPSEI